MLETILLIVIIIGLCFSVLIKPKNFPKGPVVFPLVGHYPMDNNIDPMKTWTDLAKKYGGLVGFTGGGLNACLVSGWETVKEVLLNEDCQGRPDVCLIRDRFDGDNYGVVFTEGEHWKSQRRFTLHHFRNLGFGRKSHESFLEDESHALVEDIASFKGAPTTLVERVAISVINTTWSLMGGCRYSHNSTIMSKLAKNIQESLHDIKVTGSVAVLLPFLRFIFPEWTGYNSVKRGSKGVQEFTKTVIAEHKKTIDPEKPRDLIDIYLNELNAQTPSTDQSFSEIQLEALCMDLLSAGTDTTSATVTFIIMYLATYQEKQAKVHQELDEVLGTSRLTVADKNKLVYLNAVMHEILRLRGPLPIMIPHKCTQTTEVAGYTLPEGTLLLIDVYSIHMDEKYWDDPKTFRPERFITDDGKLRKEERFIPFGKGRRACLGETLGRQMTFMFFASLMKNFKFTWSGEIPNLKGEYGFTLAPPNATLIATPRS